MRLIRGIGYVLLAIFATVLFTLSAIYDSISGLEIPIPIRINF